MGDNGVFWLHSCPKRVSRSTNCCVIEWDRPGKAERDNVPLRLNMPQCYVKTLGPLHARNFCVLIMF